MILKFFKWLLFTEEVKTERKEPVFMPKYIGIEKHLIEEPKFHMFLDNEHIIRSRECALVAVECALDLSPKLEAYFENATYRGLKFSGKQCKVFCTRDDRLYSIKVSALVGKLIKNAQELQHIRESL